MLLETFTVNLTSARDSVTIHTATGAHRLPICRERQVGTLRVGRTATRRASIIGNRRHGRRTAVAVTVAVRSGRPDKADKLRAPFVRRAILASA